MVFYRTKKYDYAQVVPVECESETAKFVVIKGQRNAKRSNYENYFHSELEAWQFLIAQHTSSCDYHRRELHKYNTALGQCEAAAKKVEAAKTSHNTGSPKFGLCGMSLMESGECGDMVGYSPRCNDCQAKLRAGA